MIMLLSRLPPSDRPHHLSLTTAIPLSSSSQNVVPAVHPEIEEKNIKTLGRNIDNSVKIASARNTQIPNVIERPELWNHREGKDQSEGEGLTNPCQTESVECDWQTVFWRLPTPSHHQIDSSTRMMTNEQELKVSHVMLKSG